MVIYENKTVRIEYDPSVPCVSWVPLEFMEGDAWRTPFTVGMDFYEKQVKATPALTWLNDARKLKSVRAVDIRWLNPNVNDRAYRLGGRKVAFVLPENIFGKMAIKLYVEFTTKRSDNKLQIRSFNNYEKAINWLKDSSGNEIGKIKL